MKSEQNRLLRSRNPSLHAIGNVGFAIDFKAKIRTILARTFGVSWAQEMDWRVKLFGFYELEDDHGDDGSDSDID